MSFGPHLIAAQATIFGVLDQKFKTWCALFFHLLVVMLLATSACAGGDLAYGYFPMRPYPARDWWAEAEGPPHIVTNGAGRGCVNLCRRN